MLLPLALLRLWRFLLTAATAAHPYDSGVRGPAAWLAALLAAAGGSRTVLLPCSFAFSVLLRSCSTFAPFPLQSISISFHSGRCIIFFILHHAVGSISSALPLARSLSLLPSTA